MKKHYLKNNHCKDCKKKITDSAIRCLKCEFIRKAKLKIVDNAGEKNGQYKIGKYCRKYYCIDCKINEITPDAVRCKSCSEKLKNKGDKNGSWKKVGSFRYDSNHKYKWIKIIGNRWIQEHRYIVEKFLNRKLIEGEIIHHIDGNTDNNKLSNLYIFQKSGWHTNFETLIRHKIIDRFILKSNLDEFKRREDD